MLKGGSFRRRKSHCTPVVHRKVGSGKRRARCWHQNGSNFPLQKQDTLFRVRLARGKDGKRKQSLGEGHTSPLSVMRWGGAYGKLSFMAKVTVSNLTARCDGSFVLCCNHADLAARSPHLVSVDGHSAAKKKKSFVVVVARRTWQAGQLRSVNSSSRTWLSGGLFPALVWTWPSRRIIFSG